MYLKLALLVVLSCGSSRASLRFEEEVVTVVAQPGEASVQVTLRFCNPTDKPIAIRKVSPSCGCTEYALEKAELQPGECGTILAIIDIEGKASDVSVALEMETSTGKQTTYVKVQVPTSPGRFDAPRFVRWRVGEEPVPKKVRLVVKPGVTVKQENLFVTNPCFRAKLLPGDNANQYWVELTPEKTDKPCGAVVVPRDEAFKVHSDYIRVYGEIL